jgi:hypothetical protein
MFNRFTPFVSTYGVFYLDSIGMFVYLGKPLIMHKDKRKKRLSRKAKKRHFHKLWFQKQIPYLQAELPQMLCRDYMQDKNNVTIHNQSFVDIKLPFIVTAD